MDVKLNSLGIHIPLQSKNSIEVRIGPSSAKFFPLLYVIAQGIVRSENQNQK